MSKLKKLKEKIKSNIASYQQNGDYKDFLGFSVTFGTKNVELSIIGKKEAEGATDKKHIERPIMKIVSKMEKIQNGQIFVMFRHFSTDNYVYSHAGFKHIKIEEETLKYMIGALLEYWIGYKEAKSLKALYVDYKNHVKPETSNLYRDILVDSGFESLEGFSNTLIKPNGFYLHSGILDGNWRGQVERVINLDKELGLLLQEIDTFALEYEDAPVNEKFLLDVQTYYYENEKFQILPQQENIIVKGDEVDEKAFTYKEGVGKLILEYIKEEKKLYNLINPPTRNMRELFEKVLGLWFSEGLYSQKVEEVDALIGVGKAEEERSKLVSLLKEYKKMGTYNIDKNTREKYKVIKNDVFIYYRVKTADFYWHILIEKGIEFWMYPSLEKSYPQYIHDELKNVMDRAVDNY